MAGTSGIRAGKAFVELYADQSKLVRGMKQAETAMKAFAKRITGIGQMIAGAGTGLIAPFGFSTKMFADMGSKLNDMSARTGASVEALSTLGFAAKQSGADAELLEAGFRKMAKTVSGADEESKQATDALRKLGLEIGDLKNKSPDEQFRTLGDRLSNIKDPTMRAAASMQIFGKSGTALLPMFENGAAGLKQLEDRARALGIEMSTKDASAADSLGDSLDTLWDTIKAGGFAIGAALAPQLQKIAEISANVVGATVGWIKENRELVATVAAVAAGVTAAGIAIVGVGTVIAATGTAVGALAATVGALLSPIGLTVTAITGLGYAFVNYTDVGKGALAGLIGSFNEFKNEGLSAVGAISDALSAGDMESAMQVATSLMKLEWVKFTTLLQSQLESATNFIMTKWIDLKFSVIGVMGDISAAVSDDMAKVATPFTDAWAKIRDAIQPVVDQLKRIPELIQEILGLFSEVSKLLPTLKIPGLGSKNLRNIAIDAASTVALGPVLGTAFGALGTPHKAFDAAIGDDRELTPEQKARKSERHSALDEARRQALAAQAAKHNQALADAETDVAEARERFNKAIEGARGRHPAGTPGRPPTPVENEFSAAAEGAKAAATNVGGISGADVRTAEGFKGVAALLRQSRDNPAKAAADTLARMKDTQDRELIYQRRMADALGNLVPFAF